MNNADLLQKWKKRQAALSGNFKCIITRRFIIIFDGRTWDADVDSAAQRLAEKAAALIGADKFSEYRGKRLPGDCALRGTTRSRA